jgi:hypothetical protein
LLLRSLELAVEVILLWRHASPSLARMARRRTTTTEHAYPPWCDKNHRRAYPDILAERDLPS